MNSWTIKDIKNLIKGTLNKKEISDNFLMQKWNEQSEVSNGSHHLYYHLFYRIAEKLQPSLTVELGGWRGLAAAHFAAGNLLGNVITIDHHSDPGDENHKIEMLKMTHKFPNINYYQGWTWDVYPQIEKLNQKIQILFIDGWHMYDKAMIDWNLYSRILDNNALIICDDLLKGNNATIAGMMDFWNEISNGFDKYIEDSDIHSGYPMGFFRYEY